MPDSAARAAGPARVREGRHVEASRRLGAEALVGGAGSGAGGHGSAPHASGRAWGRVRIGISALGTAGRRPGDSPPGPPGKSQLRRGCVRMPGNWQEPCRDFGRRRTAPRRPSTTPAAPPQAPVGFHHERSRTSRLRLRIRARAAPARRAAVEPAQRHPSGGSVTGAPKRTLNESGTETGRCRSAGPPLSE